MSFERTPGETQSGFTFRSPLYWLTAAFAAGIAAIGLLALLVPIHAASMFGVPVKSVDAASWVRIAGVRDIAYGAVMGSLLAFREKRAAGLLILLSIIIPAGDAFSVLAATGMCFQVFFHGSSVIFMAVLGIFLLRR